MRKKLYLHLKNIYNDTWSWFAKVIALEWEHRLANIFHVIFSHVINMDQYNKPGKLGHQLDIPSTRRKLRGLVEPTNDPNLF